MWIRDVTDSFDQLFNDLIRECKSRAPGTPLTYKLRQRLEQCELEERKLIVSRVEDGCAPLFIACKRGHEEIVAYLIVVCHADIEQRGSFEVPDDRSIHRVTPLWCAAVSGKLPVVKQLVSYGADVNAVSDSGSTPVRSACFMTHMDIISFLVEKGADIFKANYNGGTCLINSIQSVELCIYLLKHGVDVNATDVQNKSALHYAIQEYRLETTKLLLKYNADPYLKSAQNDDALQTACLKGAIEIFEYLVDKLPYSPERLADAYELLGSTCFEDHNDTQKALEYWRTALTIRSENGVDGVPIPKRPVLPKRDTYRNATEFTTLRELNAIAVDVDAIRIQSLLICERILSPYRKESLYRLMFRGACYADDFRYQPCIDLWRRALEIRVAKDSILYSDTCFTAQALLRLMVDLNEKTIEVVDEYREKEEPRFCDVVAIFKLLSGPLASARKLLEYQPVHPIEPDSYMRIFKCVTHFIYLLVETARTNDDKTLTKQLVRELVKQNPTSVDGEDTLLHLCVSSNTISNSTLFSTAVTIPKIFPQLDVVKLLLECGADVNARNVLRSTPLHIATEPRNFDSSLVKLLLDYGAHIDTPNKVGDIPIEWICTNPLNNVKLVNYISLQCYAARAIAKYGIRCTELPRTLYTFLELHKC